MPEESQNRKISSYSSKSAIEPALNCRHSIDKGADRSSAPKCGCGGRMPLNKPRAATLSQAAPPSAFCSSREGLIIALEKGQTLNHSHLRQQVRQYPPNPQRQNPRSLKTNSTGPPAAQTIWPKPKYRAENRLIYQYRMSKKKCLEKVSKPLAQWLPHLLTS
jgi:hypothetical protein